MQEGQGEIIETEGGMLLFLKKVREGKLGKIDESSKPYARYKILRESIEENYYYYSIR